MLSQRTKDCVKGWDAQPGRSIIDYMCFLTGKRRSMSSLQQRQVFDAVGMAAEGLVCCNDVPLCTDHEQLGLLCEQGTLTSRGPAVAEGEHTSINSRSTLTRRGETVLSISVWVHCFDGRRSAISALQCSCMSNKNHTKGTYAMSVIGIDVLVGGGIVTAA